jgi:predicted nucleic acid-binding protein
VNAQVDAIAEGIIGPIPVLVVDASVALDLLEGNEHARAALADVVAQSGQLLVPPHFWAEVANVLIRRRRTPLETAIDLRSLADVGIEVADRGLEGIVDSIALGDRHRLTASDAIYLQLALDVDGSLATLDRDLAAAARHEGIALPV